MLGKLIQEFEARNISILAIGCDTVPNYRKWIKDIEELNSTKINFPLLADPEMKVLYKFGCARDIPPKKEYKLLCNGAFIIDLDFRIRFSYKYSTHVGRNLYELLRAYDALQLALTHRIVTPSNWGMGQDVLLHNDVTNEEANHLRFAVVKPYFRLAACPEGSE
jgi:alkyl hydroperoxide reductase subunit AhpC